MRYGLVNVVPEMNNLRMNGSPNSRNESRSVDPRFSSTPPPALNAATVAPLFSAPAGPPVQNTGLAFPNQIVSPLSHLTLGEAAHTIDKEQPTR